MALDRTEIMTRIEFTRNALNSAREGYIQLLAGNVSSYSLGSRSVTRLDIDKLLAHIKALEKQLEELEAQLNGGKARKAVGAVLVDW